MLIFGLNPVVEALRGGRLVRLIVGPRAGRRVDEAVALARRAGVPVERADAVTLDRLARGGVHQGVAGRLAPVGEHTIHDLVTAAGDEPALLVVLDGVEDPQNVGAILRTADAVGAHGVIRQDRHAASLDGVVAKASAGALAHVRIATVVNVARALEALADLGVWAIGLAGESAVPYDEVDLTLPTAVIVGAEGTGLRRLVRERCDRLVSIPMRGRVPSLNVSVATGIMLFEAERQRRARRPVDGSVRGGTGPA